MKRFLFAILTFLVLSGSLHAAHIIGGEMRYVYVGPGVAPNSKIYRIVLLLFKGDDPAGAPLAGSYIVAIYNNDNGLKFPGSAGSTGNNWLITQDIPPGILPVPIILPICIQGAPVLAYTYASYSMTVELPDNLNGYTVAYQTCCRISGMINVGPGIGSTYNCIIPGTNQLGSGTDSSPQFGVPVNVVCKNAPFTLNFSAADPDGAGDSLVYSLCNAYDGGFAANAGFDNPAAPPYNPVLYNPPYTSGNPFGTFATINPQTGIISGMAPDFGKYVVCVCIMVFRNGIPFATHRKDLIVQVSDCVVTVANPVPSFVTCDGFDIQFSHNSTGANTVFWDFGDPATLADTSNLNSPSYIYPDTGVYTVKFVINRGTSCADSVYRTVGVYPGFFPGFIFSGSCYQNAFQFTDTTNTRYGVVNSWRWNFGDLATIGDTSRIRNPLWTYAGPGLKTVSLIVTNSKGCVDTADVVVDVLDKPPHTLAFTDTLICRLDAVQLGITGPGNFSWSPPVNIINANSPNPTVSPPTTQWYYVDQNDRGCLNRDSVLVRVVNSVTLAAMPDTTICQGDAIQLYAISDGLTYSWTPAANLDVPTSRTPIAITNTTTPYTVTARIGSCSAVDQVIVTTIPYPLADAGLSPTICYNTSAQLNASITGSSFRWSPVAYLNDSTILNPISTPPRTTQYILSAYDTLGCPKPGRDTLIVTVNPKLRAYAGRDTTVVVGQPLQLIGSGGVNYLWSPPTGLTRVDIFNPIGVYGPEIDSVRYKLVVTDAIGCADSAYVIVRVFQTNPYVFVPTAFTPDNNGLNDVVRPICVGIQKLNYFRIYNRWGELVFTTTNDRQGWDGRISGRNQDSGVFVWTVSAIDYLGRPLFLKGTVTLIR
ncbi:MAG: PKD domain-containing protein [Chitinophagaceae bacterium]